MNEFKVGDKVIVDVNADFSVFPHGNRIMRECLGKEAIVTSVRMSFDTSTPIAKLDIDNGAWNWNILWLKKANPLSDILTDQEIEELKYLNNGYI